MTAAAATENTSHYPASLLGAACGNVTELNVRYRVVFCPDRAFADTFNEQGRAAIERFVAGMDGDRARRTKWNGLAAELDAELKIVKVKPLVDLWLLQTIDRAMHMICLLFTVFRCQSR